jgi:hypothetical protein
LPITTVRLVVLDAAGVLGQNLDDLPRDVGDDLVHELHGLDDAERLPGADGIPHLDVGVLARCGRPVEGPDHGRAHRVQPVHLGRNLGFRDVWDAMGGWGRGGDFGHRLDRDLGLPLADPDLTHPALAQQPDELLDLI